MTIGRRARDAASWVLLLVALTSCATSEADSEATATPTIRLSPSPTSASDAASSGATEAVQRYYVLRDQLRKDPKRPLDLLETVTIGTELGTQRNLFRRERKSGLHQTGETKVAVLEVQAVILDNSDPSIGKVPTVQVDVCFDVSDVDIVKADGESVVIKDRADTGWQRYIVANYEYDSDPAHGWKVASGQDIEREPCDAS